MEKGAPAKQTAGSGQGFENDGAGLAQQVGVDVARRLQVSSRSLQRAFAGTGECLAGYIRRRRLEEARRALVDGRGRASVAQVAARYQFADSSHFIRTFKRRFGDTPANFLRQRLPFRT